MPKIMLINVTHSEESRVAIIKDRVLESFEIESLSREHLKGNLYKGTVHRIHPALEAAFVDIGAERDAFLPLDEICFKNHGDLPPPVADESGRRRRRIRDVLKPGQEILVQIAKEQFANKPPTLTTFYSLPGRYLVLLPGSDDTGISRRIEGDERQRLRKLVSDLNPPEGFGLIVRTAAGLDEETGELSRDLAYLQRLWSSVQQAAAHKRAPALVYREQDIVLRTIRDLFTPDIDEIHIDNEEVFTRARDFLQNVMPGKEHVLHCYRGEQPIFSAFDLESQIETVFKRRVPLRSGGSIVVDGTEALTAIDVNSGGSVRSANPEETAFRTNVEAANEVARQMRLRDIGGLIVVDFIDMRDARHIQEVERTLRDAMKPDKARHELGRISRLGLLEISRQRMRPAAMATTYTACPMCEGHGAVRTTESAALVALRKIHNRVSLGDVATLRVALPPSVALYLLNQKRDELARLEQRYDSRLVVDLRDALMPHQIELEVKARVPAEKVVATIAPGGVAVADAPAAAAHANGNGAAAANGDGKKRRRRRGRRRGGGLRAAAAIGIALTTLSGTVPPPFDPEALGLAAGAAPGTDLDMDDGDEDDLNLDTSDVTEAAPAPAAASEAAAPKDAPARGETAAPSHPARGRRGGRRRRGSGRRSAEGAAPAPNSGAAARAETHEPRHEPHGEQHHEPAAAPAPVAAQAVAPNPALRQAQGERKPAALDHAESPAAPSAVAQPTAEPTGEAPPRRAKSAGRARPARSKAAAAAEASPAAEAAPAKPRARRSRAAASADPGDSTPKPRRARATKETAPAAPPRPRARKAAPRRPASDA